MSDRRQMETRYVQAAAVASTQFGVISTNQLETMGIDASLRYKWVKRGLLERLGPHSYAIAGSVDTWRRSAWAAMTDIGAAGYLAGRTAARLSGLDGFVGDNIEVLVKRNHRGLRSVHTIASTELPLTRGDSIVIDGIRCLNVERLILDSPLFGFSRQETENAIDSGIRLHLISEQRLRTKVIARHRSSINGGRILLDALVDAGGESRLERWFLTLVRSAGLPRPELQRVWRDGSRTVARVDAFFPGGLIVELSGHATHSSRRDRQRDEQRRTELTLRGNRVITFTYDDVRDRPEWVVARLLDAIALAASA